MIIFTLVFGRSVCIGYLQGAHGCGGLCFVFRGFVVLLCVLFWCKQFDVYDIFEIFRCIGIDVATLFLIACVSVASVAFSWLL